MKTIKERAKAIIFEHESDIATAFSRAFALVQEIDRLLSERDGMK